MTEVNEIADGIYRISTLVPEIGPTGFTFNQFLVDAEEPLLFHTGARGMFPVVSEAIATVMPVERLRWIMFGHFEADECGAMNQFLADAPKAEVVHGGLAVMVSLGDLADRPPRAVADGEVLDLGAHRLRFIPTPHVPHGWESGLWFDETTRTLFSGDIFTQIGDVPAVTGDDIVWAALEAEALFHSTSCGPNLVPVLHQLADLEPTTLAVMHGSSFHGDGGTQLRALAAGYAAELADR